MTGSALVQAARHLGSGYDSPSTHRALFNDNADGAAAYQQLSFSASCGCVTATGAVQAAS